MGYPIYYHGELNVTPALTESDAEILTAIINGKTSDAAQPILDAISLQEDTEIPAYDGQLEVSEDGSTIRPEDRETCGGVSTLLGLLLTHFFIPRGYALSGQIAWSANDDSTDRGVIYIDGDNLEIVDDQIVNSGPSWKPEVYMSVKVAQLIQSLAESASSEGCSPELTVVSAAELKALHAASATTSNEGAVAAHS